MVKCNCRVKSGSGKEYRQSWITREWFVASIPLRCFNTLQEAMEHWESKK